MMASRISAAITIPFMYFASYKPTQQMFVKKPKIDRALFINVLWVIVITLFISFALNNIITMSPLIGLSEGYARANESFYASTLVIELIGSAILSPIMEELVFRGIVFGNMRKIMNVPQAVFLSALLFGLIHFNIVQFVYAFLLGLVLAAFMYKSGHVYAAMIGHITANAFAVIRTETGICHVPWCWCCDILLLCEAHRRNCLAWTETECRQNMSIVQFYEYEQCDLG